MSGTEPTKKLALLKAQDAEADIRAESWVDPRKSRTLLREWVPRWERGRVLELTTADTDARIVAKHILGVWGDREIGSIGHEELQAWIPRLSAAGLSAWTILGIVSQMSACLAAAVRAGLVRVNPCDGLKLPQAPPPRDMVYQLRETHLIRRLVSDPADRVLYLLLEWTGLRLGEASGLHVAQIDMVRRVIEVRRTLVHRGGVRRIKPYPKSAADRDVPIPDRLFEPLGEHLDTLPPADECDVEHQRGDRCLGGLVFRHQYMGHVNRRRCLEVWTTARTLADAKDRADGGPGVRRGTVHDLRHTYATRLVEAAVPLYDVKTLLGHSSIRTTERYAHRSPSMHARATSVLNGL